MSRAGRQSLRFRLKDATAEAHARLDGRVAGLNLGDRDVYGRFLLAHAAVVAPTERALERAGVAGLLADWPQRRRSAALAEDMARLQLTSLAIAGPVVDGEAESFGALYVMEGSRLGGRILAARAEASDDPAVRGAVAYLNHGSGDRLWASFLDSLEESVETRDRFDRAQSSALSVFTAFSDALDQNFA